MSRLASWLRRQEIDAEEERKVAKAVLESTDDAPAHPNAVHHDDRERKRGIPIVGSGLGGKVTSSRPTNTCAKCGKPPRGRRRCRCQ